MEKLRHYFYYHPFMVFTILAYAALFFDGRLSLNLFLVGGSSGVIALGVGSSTAVPYWISFICFIWIIVFPIALTISYILVFKKRYIPFCVLMILDFFVVLAYTMYTLFVKDSYGFESMLPDFIISFIIATLTIVETYKRLNVKKQRTVCVNLKKKLG